MLDRWEEAFETAADEDDAHDSVAVIDGAGGVERGTVRETNNCANLSPTVSDRPLKMLWTDGKDDLSELSVSSP